MAKTTVKERVQKKDKRLLEIVAAAAWEGDWTGDGEWIGLVTAGAERLLKHFVIEFHTWRHNREGWKDGRGDCFAWTYRALVKFNGSQILAEGRYSNRDPFWRQHDYEHPVNDEGDVRSGARHLCLADGVKSILGLRKVSRKKMLDAGLDESIIVRSGQEGDK